MSPEATREARNLALRLAFAVALGLALGEAQGQALPFLAPLFAVQLLAASRRPPTLAQGLGFAVVIVVAGSVALLITGLLLDQPVILILLLALVFFLAFLADRRGLGGPLPGFLMITNAAVPVLALQAPELAAGIVWLLIEAAFSAVLLAWAVHAVFPAAGEGIAPPAPAGRAGTARAAFADMLAVMLLLAWFLIDGSDTSVVVLVTVITILRQPAAGGARAALGLLLGNLLGGLAALVAYQFLTALPSLAFLFLLALLAGLLFGGRVATAGAAAPVYVVGLVTFLILLSLGLSPTPSGTGETFLARLVDVVLAAAYALAAVSLLLPARRERPIPAS